ncbi:hypothetical protein CISG_02714 [Coccidioides immitis RMSCC 3703]|uniref:Uncharacterized protein n=2 Tax=Coccidioides immitis TaxID=5501 RepID=A0A0J8RA08_COCIT|nr:hypothetical protein CIRG_00358 [Coccidioides immitis RMSCC 2394]KMU81696.1 hypothetical protein CISG_02714 [Coccidioides immitis RMSCC 3703]
MTTRSSSAASLVLEAGLGDVCSVVIYIEVPDPPSSTPDRELDFAPLRPTPPQGTSNLWKVSQNHRPPELIEHAALSQKEKHFSAPNANPFLMILLASVFPPCPWSVPLKYGAFTPRPARHPPTASSSAN